MTATPRKPLAVRRMSTVVCCFALFCLFGWQYDAHTKTTTPHTAALPAAAALG